MSRPEIVMQTPAAKKLEAEVQRKLAEYSYSTADDVVMAEYVVVMLANAKTPDQITAELSELIGEDMYDPAFTTWLFEEVARQYGIPQTNSNPPLSPTETQDNKSFSANNNNNNNNNDNDNDNHQSLNDAGDKIQTVNDSRDHQQINNYNRPGPIKRAVHPTNPNRPITHSNNNNNNNSNSNSTNNRLSQPGGLFSQAVTGIKRSGPNDLIRDTPPHRRLRQDDYPSGPLSTGPRSSDRNPRDQHWNGMISDRRDLSNGQRPPTNFPIGHPMGAESAAKSILERVGVSVNPNHPFQNTGFPRGYDQHQQPFRRPNDLGHNNGTAPSQQQMFYGSPSSYPLPLLPPHPFQQQHFNPHNSPNGATPQLFLANGQPYIPSHPFQIPGSGPNPIYPYPAIQHPSPNNQSKKNNSSAIPHNSHSKPNNHHHHHHHQQQQQQQSSLENRVAPIAQPVEPVLAPLPSAPLLREECKYNLACKNAWCPSSHCSPKGHPKSSMLLSFYPCELQLKCTDPECLKAHVSPQQADPKASIKVNSAASKPSGPSMTPAGRGALPGGGTPTNGKAIPCRFGSQCTRSDCVFSHPWIVNSAGGAERPSNNDDIGTPAGPKNSFGAAGVPCKFGLQCSRPDCFYQHPSSHRGPSKNISKSFINQQQQQPASKQPSDPSSGPSSSSLLAGGGIGGGLAGTEKLSPSKKFSAPIDKQSASNNPAVPSSTTTASTAPQLAPSDPAPANSPQTQATQEPLVTTHDGDPNPTTSSTAAPSIQPAPSTPIPA
ncbi:hypothetical protein PGT21_027954 [Puccinia graminis f. sp. tritici]|uniref:C3H1-type domain-containing protein n=1 Tax=Puccinia graminis f. sp. tritici TaxID=56615 RepID=A0A5B0S765_PUCGR|nr:hypothetical protein PGT21_027954 [Puccinia graminis f. sp. tritici]KAA1132983.1 hypothetical protein PGTUg99_017859 [Puccinia graminis f. sp. tritici]